MDWDGVGLGCCWVERGLGWDGVVLGCSWFGMKLSRIGTGVSAWRELENCNWDEVLRLHRSPKPGEFKCH